MFGCFAGFFYSKHIRNTIKSFLLLAVVMSLCLMNAPTPSWAQHDTRLHGGRGGIGIVQCLSLEEKPLLLAVRLNDFRYALINPHSGVVFRRSARRFAAVCKLPKQREELLAVWSRLEENMGTLVMETLKGTAVWTSRVRIPPFRKRRHADPTVLIYDLNDDGEVEIIVPVDSGELTVLQGTSGRDLADSDMVRRAKEIVDVYPLCDNPSERRSSVSIKGDKTYFYLLEEARPQWTPQPLDGRPVTPFSLFNFEGDRLWEFDPPPPRGINRSFPQAVFSAEIADIDGDGLNALFLGGYNRVFIITVDGTLVNLLEKVFF